MILIDAFLALVFTVVLGVILTAALGIRGPWAAPWALFLVLFLMIWAGAIWITPAGPAVPQVRWVPFLLFGILMALFLASVSRRQPRIRPNVTEVEAPEVVAALGLTIFFWVLIAALGVAIVVRYV
jgi:hypothetical protein